MRLLKLTLLLALLSPALAQAQATLPNNTISTIYNKLVLHEGIGYDIKSGNATSYTATDLIDWKDLSISAGYSTTSAIVASIDYDIGGLSKLGLTIPLLSIVDLRIGFMVGISDLSTASSSGSDERNKLVYGPEITIVSTKF